jgi:hypothetical protein
LHPPKHLSHLANAGSFPRIARRAFMIGLSIG